MTKLAATLAAAPAGSEPLDGVFFSSILGFVTLTFDYPDRGSVRWTPSSWRCREWEDR